MVNKFKVGDEVRYINSTDRKLFGKVGVIKKIDTSGVPYKVLFYGIGNQWCLEANLELTRTVISKDAPIRDPENGSLSCKAPIEPTRYFDAHYGGDVQPIELMQMILTPEQFIGFLMGNIIKYSMRCGKKDAPEKELTKIRRYKAWLDQARNGEIINPRV